ncbi:MAG: hypothetical protein WB290_01920 [Smithella sp.]
MKEKKKKPRTEDKARFAKEHTDADFLKALNECQKEATSSALEVAEKIGCSPRYAKDRLLQLAEHGKIERKMKGNTWGFKP